MVLLALLMKQPKDKESFGLFEEEEMAVNKIVAMPYNKWVAGLTLKDCDEFLYCKPGGMTI